MKNKYIIFFTAVILLWIKSYIVHRVAFDLPLENEMQQWILFINPLSSAVLFLGFSLLFSGKGQKRALFILYFISSFVLYANAVYYREFDDFITLPVLFTTKNFADLGPSVLSLLNVYDPLFFADMIVLALLMKYVTFTPVKAGKKSLNAIFAAGLILLVLNVALAEIQRPQLLTRTFDRVKLVKLLGTYNYQIYDALLHVRTNAQRAFAGSNDLVDIYNYVNSNHVEPNPEFFGSAQGKNIIVISMESIQNFVIDRELNGEEITPFLNSLAGNGWFYFDQFYHQVGQGKTSDAEFIFETGLYPLPSGAVFTTNAQNEYNGLPSQLGERGYYSAVFHGNNASFWNRDIMYNTLGYDHFYDAKAYEQTPENSINYGIKDIPFFNQSMKYIDNLPEPFYTKFITLTNHFDFQLDDPDDMYIDRGDTGNPTVDGYFQTVRYMDESLKIFMNKLKESGVYDDSIIIMYGDHYGISTNHNRAMSEILGKEITPYEVQQLQRVPLFIHIPGMKGDTKHTVSGQIDLKPTLMHLLGMNTKNQISFGSGLFSKERPEFAVSRDGSFVTKNVVYTDGNCYKKPYGTLVDKKMCEPYIEKAKTELQYSDKVVYGDLLRFLDEVKTSGLRESSNE